jgi:hypothetical protein
LKAGAASPKPLLWRIVLSAAAVLAVAAVPLRADGTFILYPPSENAMAEVDAALMRADAAGRLALIVLGADWCHDSRALAERLQTEPLAGLIAQHYETVLVDVGYLERGQDIVRRFGVPVYYATPTVLIVEPATGHLVNAGDRHQWGAAASIGMPETVGYFTQMASQRPGPQEPAGEALAHLYAEIAAYERDLAGRVSEGYAVVGPMLRAYKEGQAPEEFEDIWNELSEFRNAIPGVVENLRREARRRVAEGETNIPLSYPEFATFSWDAPGP